MMKRLLIGVLSIAAGTALVLTSFACARLEGGGSVNGPPMQETPSAAFQGPSVAVAEIATTTPEPEPEPEWIEGTATAYCSCEICCGEWALNRPNGIVYTASGVCEDDRHEEGVTCGSRIYDPDHPDAPCSARSKKPEGAAVIRIADLCGHLGIDLDAVIEEKMAYNAGRPYKHGKRF